MSARVLLVVPVVVPIAMATLVAAVRDRLGRLLIDVLAAATAAGMTVVALLLVFATSRQRLVTWLSGWHPVHGFDVGIPFVVDRFAAVLLLMTAAVTTAVLVFSWKYFEDVEGFYHALVLVFLGAMSGFVITGDLFDMFVFFELMGAVAFALTGYKNEEARPVVGALNFGIVNSLGAFCWLTGLAMLYARTGRLAFADLGGVLAGQSPDALVVVSFVLIATGLLVKAAVVPFHFWTADAEAVAPTPACVLFSCVMVELGLYGVARVYWEVYSGVLPHPAVRLPLLCFGAVTAVLGAVMCWLQHHLKRLLAYSTISHVGVMLMGVALLSSDGLAGAGLYALGHAGVKGALFLCTGVLLQRFSSVGEAELHGRGRRTPVVGVVWVVAGLGLSGLPPFGLGLGKSVMEDASILRGYSWAPAVFVLSGVLTGGAVLRVAGRVFLGWGSRAGEDVSSEEEEENRETTGGGVAHIVMLVPAVALTAAALAVGLLPGVARDAGLAATRFVDVRRYADAVLSGRTGLGAAHTAVHGFSTLGLATGTLAAVAALALAALGLWGDRLPSRLRGRAGALAEPVVGRLRLLHSGHIGDYAAWLVVGVAVLGGAVALAVGGTS